MTFTVEDFQDLIRLLDEHPEWRAGLRRQVLSDELLDLPALVQRIGDRLEQLTDRVERLEAVVERLADSQERMESRLGSVDGEVLELRYARRAPSYLSRIARRLRVLDSGPLADLLDEAVDAGRLNEAERDDLLLADLVLTGRRREDQADVYLLVEVPSTIDPHDVTRAFDRARTFEKLGKPVLPVVAGRQINAEAVLLAREHDVWQNLEGLTLS